ncbi:reverse transcriptase domain-containing protein [Tanacetum coccineum]
MNPAAFLFPIRLEGRINENALADTGSDTNTMPYRIYKQLGRDDIMKEERNITMINYTEAKVTGRLVNVLCQVGFATLYAKFLILEIPVDWDAPIVVGRGFLDTIRGNIDIPNRIFTTFDGLTRQTFRAARSEKIRIAESDSDDKEDYVIKRNEMGTTIHNSRPIGYHNNTNPAENMTLSTLESVINPFRKISVWKKAVSFLGSLPAKLRDVEWKPNYKLCYSNPELATGQWKTEIRLTDPYGNIYMHAFVTKPTKRKLSKYHKLSDIMSPNWKLGLYHAEELEEDGLIFIFRDLDRTTLRELIDSEDRLILDIPNDDEEIERMEYRQSYHWDRYQGVFEQMAGVYNVPLQGAYNPPGYAQPSTTSTTSSTIRSSHHNSSMMMRRMSISAPGELRTSPRVPAYFHNRNTALLQTFDLTAHDFDSFLDEVEFVVDLDLIQQYSKRRCSSLPIYLKKVQYNDGSAFPFAKKYHPFHGDTSACHVSYLKLKVFPSYVGIALLAVTGGLDTALDLNDLLSRLVDDLWASELSYHL